MDKNTVWVTTQRFYKLTLLLTTKTFMLMRKNFKWLLALVAMVASVNLMAGVITFTPDSKTSTSSVSVSPISFAFTNGSTATKWYDDGLRFYEGATITVSSENTITQIEFTHGASNNGCLVLDGSSTGTYSSMKWTGSAKSIKFKVTHSSGTKNGQVKLTQVKVTYEGTAKTLTSIAISGNPTKTTYEAGETFDPAGLVVTGTYDDKSEATITDGIEWTITPSPLTAGTTSVSVTATVDKITSDAYQVNGLTVNAIEGDRLTLASTGVSSGYTAWNDKVGSQGIAKYAGQSSNGNSSIQMRNQSPSGIVSTTSAGIIKKVKVDWNTNTVNGRSVKIYGSNTAYTESSDIYDEKSRGTELGSIVKGTTELEISGDYAYVGVLPVGGAMYLNSITFVWSAPKVLEGIAVKTAPTTTTYAVGEFFSPAGLVITATYDDQSTADIAYEGNEDKFSFSPALDAALATTNEKVTITYGGKSCNQAITVKNIELTSIVVSGNLSKTEYTAGEDFDFTGLVATGYYSDESNKDITDQVNWSIDPATLSAGQTSVSVIATSGLISGNKSYNITVNEAPKVIDNWNTLFKTSYTGSISGLKGQNDLVLEGTTDFGVTVKVENHASTNGYIKDQDLRLYTNNNGDYTFTVTAPTGKVFKQIVATKADKDIAVKEKDEKGTISVDGTSGAMTWTGKANSLVFIPTATTGFGTMTFVIAESAPSAATPTITPSTEAEIYWEPITVTLATTTEGAAIYYTTNGDAPTAASTLYEAPFQVSATTTVKAIAVKEGLDNSEVASKIFSFGKVFDNIAACFADETLQNGDVVKISNVSAVITSFAGSGKTVYFEGGSFYVNATYPKTYAIGGTLSGSNLQFTYMNYDPKQLRPASWETLTYTAPSPTGVNNVKANAKATKAIVNGQIVIVRDNKTYNVLGF
ncbi:MAG: chitobiase/beta-hexosaminidase C-terminal domain-containing protein [Paludibacteraceae bacterium]|nr:chitobiase/beta-hexosaminidase C-terminal domain-containing protein [Paludibacteraceae bacterium]